jgi:hypothetical protein
MKAAWLQRAMIQFATTTLLDGLDRLRSCDTTETVRVRGE